MEAYRQLGNLVWSTRGGNAGSVPFQVAQLNRDGGLDSRESGNDGL